MKKIGKILKTFVFKSVEDYVTIHAAYSTLFTFMAIFPMLIILFILLTRMGVTPEYLMNKLHFITPEFAHGLLDMIIQDCFQNSSSFVLSLSIVVTLWSASSGVYGILLGLNDVYRTYDTRSYIRQRLLSIVYSVVFIAIIAFSLFLLVCGNQFSNFIESRIPSLKPAIDAFKYFRYPAIFVVFVFFFNLIYWLFPYQKTRYFSHTIGSAFSALGWLALSYIFSLWVDHFNSFSTYGSLSTIILFLFWLWILMIIIFLGAEINAIVLDHFYGKDANHYRKLHRDLIHKYETAVREYDEIKYGEQYNLRKSPTRQVEVQKIREIDKELKEAFKKKQKEEALEEKDE